MTKTVYHAAPLFNWPDQVFNLKLTEKLKTFGYNVFLPQTEGFLFAELEDFLKKVLPKNEVSNAVNHIIYFLDKGWFLGRSDLCLARLDEPIDEGVVDEINFSKMIGIPVVGFRTDVRTPYGSAKNDTGGMHFFPAYTCDKFILSPPEFNSLKIENSKLGQLVEKIDQAFRGMAILERNYSCPLVEKVGEVSKKLFDGIQDIHSEEGLKAVAERYSNHKKYITEEVLPEIIKN